MILYGFIESPNVRSDGNGLPTPLPLALKSVIYPQEWAALVLGFVRSRMINLGVPLNHHLPFSAKEV